MLVRLLLTALLLATGLVSIPAAVAEGPASERVIVVLRDAASARATAAELARRGAVVHHRYAQVLTGFAATVPAGRLEALRRDPRVQSVVADGLARPDDHGGTPWGLDRIDQRKGPGDGVYSRDTDGAGVTAYVIDSGIRTSHADFGGRARWGVDLVDGSRTDCTGHGTHVAGTVGGATYGVAPAVQLVAVRVFGCSHDVAASWSTIIAGLDWVVADRTGPSVVNMSLSGAANPAMDDAVARATAAGVAVVVTAGNDDFDACQKSPARAPSALTIGATQRTDAKAPFSNVGPCLDLFAPGVDIPSASTWDDRGHWLSSGTSMAAAHVSGAVARQLQSTPTATVAEVAGSLVSGATQGVVTAARSTNAHLLHVPAVTPTATPAPTPAPARAAAPGAPGGVAAVATGATTAVLHWTAPADDGGSPVTGYVVSGPGMATATVAAGTTSSSIGGLTSGATYVLGVRAVNAHGTGYEATSTYRAPVVPTAPQAVTASANAHSVSVSWRPPTSDGGAAVRAYLVRIVDPTGAVVARQPDAAAQSVTVPVPGRKTAYRVEVLARNVVGDGPAVTRSVTTK